MSAPRKAHCSEDPALHDLFAKIEARYPQFKPVLQIAHAGAQGATHLIDAAAAILVKARPYFDVVAAYARKLNLHEYIPMLVGLMVCFFGGYFILFLTALEAVRLLCWSELQESFEVLHRNYLKAYEENAKDNEVDEDGNGIADVLEINRSELFSRKVALFARTVDISEVQYGARTLGAAAMSVIAALRVRVAQVATLGLSLAQMARQYIPLEAFLADSLPPELRQWAGSIAMSIFQAAGVVMAFLLHRVINSLHCAARGAHVFVKYAVRLGYDKGLLEDTFTMDSPKAKALIMVVTAMGFLWQVAHSDGLPFPVNVLLFPLTVVEFILRLLANSVLAV